MLYTRKGDDGTSGLFGTKERLPKDSAIYEALGTLDELNSLFGICRAKAADSQLQSHATIAEQTLEVQESIFIMQAEIAGAKKHIEQKHIDTLEARIEVLEALLAEHPKSFIVPGSNELSAWFDYARAVCRRAERSIVRASAQQCVSSASKAYINRLSSFLYVIARYIAQSRGGSEEQPHY